MRVLVVDDEPAVRHVMRRSLQREGYEVLEAGDASTALATVDREPVDVVILDLHLPDRSGLDLLPVLRELAPDLHIIMLTSAATETDRVRGLVSGADDYMAKPFSPREVTARVIAVGRRRATVPAAVLESGGLRIDLVARTVTLHGAPLELTRRELDLLSHLVANEGRTFSRGELLSAVWGSSAEWQGESTVTEHVRRLRLKVERDPRRPAHLVTVRGAGYRYDPPRDAEDAPATVADAPGAAPGRLAPELSTVANVVVADGVVVHANEAALQLTGATSASEVVGQDMLRFVAPRSHGTSMARQESARAGRWPRPELITLRRVDGQELLVEVASVPVLWDELPASQITLWDLSGDTAKVRELATGIRTEVVAEAIIVTDERFRIQSFSAGAEALYGWAEAEVLGRPMDELLGYVPTASAPDLVRASVERLGRWHGEVTQRGRDGTPIRVRTSATLLRDDFDRPVGVVSVNRLVATSGSGNGLRDPATTLADEVRGAIDRGELSAHYQPHVRLDGTGWAGVEALVRWEHPERGLLAAGEFLAAAEQAGVMYELGLLVLEQAAHQWSAWQQAGIDLHVSVNLSGRQLADDRLPRRIAEIIAETAMPPGALWVEVNESDLVDDLHGGAALLREIAATGAGISIDDFGTGWSSLAYLRGAPVHAIKVDRAFIDGVDADATKAAIVSSLVTLGHELDLAVVAEGVETLAQAHRLRTLGCELAQGYLYGRPQPPAALVVPPGTSRRAPAAQRSAQGVPQAV